MKKFFTLVAAALVSAATFATPTQIPTVADLAATYDVTNDIVVAVYFDEEICNDLVWAGSYNGWTTSPVADMIHGEALANFPGWYVFDVNVCVGDGTDQGKPVQLQADGSFDWSFQTGDVDSWVNVGTGSKAGSFSAGYSGEANCTWPEKGAYIYESQYFKLHNTPCVARVYHDYTVNLYAPTFCSAISAYADTVVCMGDFDKWETGIKMDGKLDDDFNTYYQAKFNTYEGALFKFKLGFADWSHEIQYYNETEDAWNNLGNITLGDETNGAVTYDAAKTTLTIHYDAAIYRFVDCTGEETALDEVAATDKAVKFIENGKLVIARDGKRFNAAGMEIK